MSNVTGQKCLARHPNLARCDLILGFTQVLNICSCTLENCCMVAKWWNSVAFAIDTKRRYVQQENFPSRVRVDMRLSKWFPIPTSLPHSLRLPRVGDCQKWETCVYQSATWWTELQTMWSPWVVFSLLQSYSSTVQTVRAVWITSFTNGSFRQHHSSAAHTITSIQPH